MCLHSKKISLVYFLGIITKTVSVSGKITRKNQRLLSQFELSPLPDISMKQVTIVIVTRT